MNRSRPRFIRGLVLLLLAALAFLSGFSSFLLLEENRIASLLFSIGYVLAWILYTVFARGMRRWNLLSLTVAAVTVLTILEVLLLTYTSVRLPAFLLLVSIAAAIPTLYPLLGFSAIDPLTAPVFLVLFLLAASVWCVLCIQALSRKTPYKTDNTSPDTSGKTE